MLRILATATLVGAVGRGLSMTITVLFLGFAVLVLVCVQQAALGAAQSARAAIIGRAFTGEARVGAILSVILLAAVGVLDHLGSACDTVGAPAIEGRRTVFVFSLASPLSC